MWKMAWMVIGAALTASPMLAQAAPVQWTVASGGNGHWYEIIATPGDTAGNKPTWADDKAAAELVSGYLATLTSQAENDFVQGELAKATQTRLQWMIGGFQPAQSSEPAGGWTWITGEAWSFTNWYSQFQPDNNGAGGAYPQGENALVIYSGAAGDGHLGKWNDTPSYTSYVPQGWEPIGGYVVEYEATPVPEPATLMTLGAGLLAVCSRLRSRQ